MKKTFFSTMKIMSLVLLASVSLVTSCEEEPEPVNPNGKKVVSVSATIENYTKATDSSFEEGDKIGLHILTDLTFLNNAQFTNTKGKFKAAQENYWYEDAEVEATVVGYYPYNANALYTKRGYNVEVGTDQSTDKKYKASDFMVARTTSKPTDKAVALTFNHVLSKVTLSIDPKGETIKTVTVSGLDVKTNYELREGKVTAVDSQADITPAKVSVDGKDAWVFLAVPQSNNPEIVVTTTSGKTFLFDAEGLKLESGKAYTSTLVLDKENFKTQFTVTVTDWIAENNNMVFEKVENDFIIEESYGIEDVDPTIEWPLIATLPSLISPDMAEDCVIVVNVADSGVTPGEKLYAHTGVITNLSNGGGDWKYVKHDWAVDAADCCLTHVGGTIYALLLPGGPRAFYGVPAGEELKQLAFVFRTSGGTKEVKNNGQDIYVDLVDANDLVVSFVSPAHGEIVSVGDVVSVKVVTQNAESVSLLLNESEVATGKREITYEHTVSEVGDMKFKAIATDTEGMTATEEVTVAALGDTQSMARPAGAKEGVTVEGSEATVVLFAPGKKQVVLLGDFNGFAPSNEYMMYKDGDYFWTTVSGLQPNTEYAYQFLVDGSVRVGDPYCEKVLDPWNDKWINEHYEIYPNLKEYPANSTDIVSVFETTPEQYTWKVTDFKRPNRHSLVIYELLIRDFTDEGSIDAVTEKLDYLEDLGVNAIELLPIQEFDGNNSWGYNPCFYFAADKAYGTKTDYKEFIDECHKRGIAVILDVVFNHATGQFPWAKMWWNSSKNCTAADNPFFNEVAKHNFNVYHDFNHSYAKTRSYFKEVLQFWLEEYNIDGYRFDLTKGIVQNPSNYDAGGYSAERIGWLKGYADAIREVEDDAYIIFEHFCDNREENELAAYKDIMLWRNINSASCESAMGWTGNDKSNFSGISAYGRVGFAESHDEERVAYKMKMYGSGDLKSVTSTAAVNQLTGMYALEYLSPYTKMIWQFGELAYDYSIEENGRTGEKPIPWELGYFTNTYRKSLYDNLSKIISFRTDNTKIFSSDSGDTERKAWNVGDSSMGGKTLVLSNTHGGVIVVANQSSSKATTTVSVPQTGVWTNIITGEKVTLSSSYSVTLNAHEYIVLGRVN